MAQSMKKEIWKTFGFAREEFSAKVRLDTKMPGVPIILSKSVYIVNDDEHKIICAVVNILHYTNTSVIWAPRDWALSVIGKYLCLGG